MTVGANSGRKGGARVEVPDGQGVQIGDDNKQFNQFIRTYIKELHVSPAPAAGPGVVGEVPRPPPAFQPREELLASLARAGLACVRSLERAGPARRRSRRHMHDRGLTRAGDWLPG